MSTDQRTRPGSRTLVVGIAGATALAGLGAGLPARAATAPTPRWHTSLTKSYTRYGLIESIVSLSPKSAVALASHGIDEEAGYSYQQVLHWNGVHWTVTKHQPPQNTLGVRSFSVRATNDMYLEQNDYSIRHFNGKSWNKVSRKGLPSIPTRQQYSDVLLAVKGHTWMAVSKGTNFVGIYEHRSSTHRWTKVKSFAEGAVVSSFKGTAMNAWVGGTRSGHSGLALHWTGKSWKSTVIPGPATTNKLQRGITGLYPVSNTEAMAVGTAIDYAHGRTSTTYAYRWNGKSWRTTTLPAGMVHIVLLTSVVGATGGRYWATGGPSNIDLPVGTATPGSTRSTYYRYTSGAWHTVAGPSRSTGSQVEPFVQNVTMAHVAGTSTNWAGGFVGNHDCDGQDDACPNHIAGVATIDRLS